MATRFIDGPAAGQHLLLSRAVHFLRVVYSGGDKTPWDALDQPGDSPKREERLYAYHLVRYSGRCHLNFGGGKGGWYALAEYRFFPEQPPEAIMRNSLTWQKWCEEHNPAPHCRTRRRSRE